MDWPHAIATVAHTFKGSAGNPLDMDLATLMWWFEQAGWIYEQLSG